MIFLIAMTGALAAWVITSDNSELSGGDKAKGILALGGIVAVVGAPAFILLDIIFVILGAVFGLLGIFNKND